MNDWKRKFREASERMRLLIFEINYEPVSNEVARIVIASTRNLFELALDKTTLHRYAMKPFEVLDLSPLTSVTTVLLDELLMSMHPDGFQTSAIYKDAVSCKGDLEPRTSSLICQKEDILHLNNKEIKIISENQLKCTSSDMQSHSAHGTIETLKFEITKNKDYFENDIETKSVVNDCSQIDRSILNSDKKIHSTTDNFMAVDNQRKRLLKNSSSSLVTKHFCGDLVAVVPNPLSSHLADEKNVCETTIFDKSINNTSNNLNDLRICLRHSEISDSSDLKSDSVELSDSYFERKSTVPVLRTNSEEHNGFDKINPCYFCEKLCANLSKHFAKKHFSEEVVARMLSLPINVRERRCFFDKLTGMGNYVSNINLLSSKKGSICVEQRSQQMCGITEITDFVPCPGCLHFLNRNNLKIHMLECEEVLAIKKMINPQIGPMDDAEWSSTGYIASHCDLLLMTVALSQSPSAEFERDILSRLELDIVTVVRSDWIIICFGIVLYRHVTTSRCIKQIKQLVGLLLDLRCYFENYLLYMEDVLKCEFFEVLLSCVRILCEHKTTLKIKAFMFAKALGKNLVKCGIILRGDAYQKKNIEMQKATEAFLCRCFVEWNKSVRTWFIETEDGYGLSQIRQDCIGEEWNDDETSENEVDDNVTASKSFKQCDVKIEHDNSICDQDTAKIIFSDDNHKVVLPSSCSRVSPRATVVNDVPMIAASDDTVPEADLGHSIGHGDLTPSVTTVFSRSEIDIVDTEEECHAFPTADYRTFDNIIATPDLILDECCGEFKSLSDFYNRNLGKKARPTFVRRPWTVEEQEAVRQSLGEFYPLNTLPGKTEIDKCLSAHSCLSNRTWRHVKDFVRNVQKKFKN